ncbi:MAG: pilus assembly protein PilM [Polyangia bacterium]|jgi:type IV pilus assembly protein PilM
MAHTITGIDLGSWSVKFAVFNAGFRRARVNTSFEEPVPAGEAPLAERRAEALRAGLARLPSESTITMALPGEMLALRVLDLPFSDARKVEQVVGYELEGQIMHDLSEVVMDHVILSASGTGESEAAGSRAMAVAARSEEIAAFLASLKQCGVEPRTLYATPVIYHALLAEEPTRAQHTPAGCRLFIDLGHRHSQLCFLRGDEAVFGRTSNHAGEELTLALVRASGNKWSFTQAEQAKHTHGFVPSRARQPTTPAQRQLGGVLQEALASFLRDLRQTLASFRAHNKMPVEAIMLAGGGSRLQGLAEFLQEELGIPTSLWPAPPEPAVEEAPGSDEIGEVSVVDEEGSASRARMALAFALAWAGVRGHRELDLRRGPFLYRASFSVVRQKATHLALLVGALLACAAVDGTIALKRLSGEQQQLREKLKVATKELFGEARSDATEVSAALRRSLHDEMAPLPRVTAYDLLDRISRKMPPADQVAIDVEDLDIKAKKTSIKGTVDSAASLDDVVAKLKEIDCFQEINKGPLTEVSGGGKQFSLVINSKCP